MELNKNEIAQYRRHLSLAEIGHEGQLKLKSAKVLVIGSGGLGCPILQYLTAAGVGEIGLIDNDIVDQSNLQRQILFNHNDLGKPKVLAATEKLALLNPFIKIVPYHESLTTDNAIALFAQYDIIVDGSDNFPTRYLANDATVIAGKPLVFGSIYKFEGQVSVFNYQNGPTYRCLFPSPPAPNEVPNCSEVGVLGVLPGIIGSLQANEVIKIITGIGNVLSGKLLTYSTLTNQSFAVQFDKNSDSSVSELLPNYGLFCGMMENDLELDYAEVKDSLDQYLLVDVREAWEREDFHIGGIHISVYNLINELDQLATEKPILLYCQSGNRSGQGQKLLADLLVGKTVYTLKGGVQGLQD